MVASDLVSIDVGDEAVVALHSQQQIRGLDGRCSVQTGTEDKQVGSQCICLMSKLGVELPKPVCAW